MSQIMADVGLTRGWYIFSLAVGGGYMRVGAGVRKPFVKVQARDSAQPKPWRFGVGRRWEGARHSGRGKAQWEGRGTVGGARHYGKNKAQWEE